MHHAECDDHSAGLLTQQPPPLNASVTHHRRSGARVVADVRTHKIRRMTYHPPTTRPSTTHPIAHPPPVPLTSPKPYTLPVVGSPGQVSAGDEQVGAELDVRRSQLADGTLR